MTLLKHLILSPRRFPKTFVMSATSQQDADLLRAPSHVPIGICFCSYGETSLSWTSHVSTLLFRTTHGTSILLLYAVHPEECVLSWIAFYKHSNTFFFFQQNSTDDILLYTAKHQSAWSTVFELYYISQVHKIFTFKDCLSSDPVVLRKDDFLPIWWLLRLWVRIPMLTRIFCFVILPCFAILADLLCRYKWNQPYNTHSPYRVLACIGSL